MINSSQPDLFCPKTEPQRVVLELKGMGHTVSFKNNKMLIVNGPNGRPLKKPLLITRPDLQRWMDQAVRSFEFQLCCAFQIESGAIRAEPSKLFSIVSSLPADDSVNDLAEINVKVEAVRPGEEGALIAIERA